MARAGSTINITGGVWGESIAGDSDYGHIWLERGSELHLTGTDFLLDGHPIKGLEPGTAVVLEWMDQKYVDVWLTGRLLDGSPFSADISTLPWSSPADWQSDGALAITLTAALPGDFDGNHIVDATDLAIWQTQYGSTVNGSPLRKGSDFLNWQRSFGTGTSTLADTQIPEPESWQALMFMIGLILLRTPRYRCL